MKVLTISGYKSFELGIFTNDDPAVEYIKVAVRKALATCVEEGLEWIIISGQMGVELWAAEVTLDLQIEYPELKLAVITPFLNQESKWKEANREYYEFILSQADFVDSITKREYEGPSQFRQKNDFLVRKSDGLLLVYDEEKQGSPQYLLNTARKIRETRPYTINLITFSDLQAIVEEEQLKRDDNW